MSDEGKIKAKLDLQPLNDLDVDGDGQVTVNDIKHIYKSRTFWVNVIAIVAFGIQSHFGYVLDPSIQVQILGVINIILRSITHEPVKWSKS